MQRHSLLAFVLATATLAVAAMSPSALAQERYPARPIRLVVSSAAGGVHDVIGRLWANRLKATLGTIVIDNRGGAGGVLGVGEVARAQPDGYTLLLGSNSTHILHPLIAKQALFDSIKDFEVVTIFAVTSPAIAVHPATPARTLVDLIAYAKANPGKLNYAHAGVGSISHVASEMLKQLAGGLENPSGALQRHGSGASRRHQRQRCDVPPEHHRPGDRAASNRENPHPCRRLAGAPPGAA